jgi:cyclophilin family peptidyl-prolyl cis-trans isomerase
MSPCAAVVSWKKPETCLESFRGIHIFSVFLHGSLRESRSSIKSKTMKRVSVILFIYAIFINFSAMTQTKPDQKAVKFVIHTDYGDMKGILYNQTPQHRDNFVKLAKQGYFDGLLFHRVISGFMIQGGDPNSKNAKPGQRLGSGGPGYTVPAEINPQLIHKKGALSAARQGDDINPQKASSGSQFYIVQGKTQNGSQLDALSARSGFKYTPEMKKVYETIGGTPFLDGQYTVFGEITEGLDIIDKIAAVAKDQSDRPVQDVKMTVKILE